MIGLFIHHQRRVVQLISSACIYLLRQEREQTLQKDALLLAQQPLFIRRQGTKRGGLLDPLLTSGQRLGKQNGTLAMQRTHLHQLPLRRLRDLADGLPLS